jgi:hypothetical protein
MAESIIRYGAEDKSKLPRAIAREKDGVVMYWVEELGDGGLSIRGVARLLGCDDSVVRNALKGAEGIDSFRAEIITDGGLQCADLLLSKDFSELMERIIFSRCKEETRRKASALNKKLAAAGFKLAVMLELAPEKLASLAQQQSSDQPRKLPPVRDAIEYLEAAKEIDQYPDPILRSLLNQRLMEELGAKALPSTSSITTQVILTVRAKELGFSDAQIGSGAQLGKFVSKLIPPNGKTQHGRYPVNVYDLTPDLDSAIAAFFS